MADGERLLMVPKLADNQDPLPVIVLAVMLAVVVGLSVLLGHLLAGLL